MKTSKILFLVLVLTAFLEMISGWNGVRATSPDFVLGSPAFANGGTLPKEFTCDGKRTSPPLTWTNPPAGTKFVALTMHHIAGPGDQHVYLVLYNIPVATPGLAENARDVGIFGINTVNGQQEYSPPCSKGPGPKTYVLTAYALSDAANFKVPASAVTMDLLLTAIKDRTLATSTLTVTYSREGQGRNESPSPGEPAPGKSQEGRAAGPGPRIPPELERGLAALNLSGEQAKKVDVIVQEYQEKQRQLRDHLIEQLKGALDEKQVAEIEKSLQRPPPPPPGQ